MPLNARHPGCLLSMQNAAVAEDEYDVKPPTKDFEDIPPPHILNVKKADAYNMIAMEALAGIQRFRYPFGRTKQGVVLVEEQLAITAVLHGKGAAAYGLAVAEYWGIDPQRLAERVAAAPPIVVEEAGEEQEGRDSGEDAGGSTAEGVQEPAPAPMAPDAYGVLMTAAELAGGRRQQRAADTQQERAGTSAHAPGIAAVATSAGTAATAAAVKEKGLSVGAVGNPCSTADCSSMPASSIEPSSKRRRLSVPPEGEGAEALEWWKRRCAELEQLVADLKLELAEKQ